MIFQKSNKLFIKHSCVIAFFALFCVFFSPIHNYLGYTAGALLLAGVLAGGWFFGVWGGVIYGFTPIIINLVFYSRYTGLSLRDTFFMSLPAYLVSILTGALTGIISDILIKYKIKTKELEEKQKELNDEIENKIKVEKELVAIRSNLEALIKVRTKKLEETLEILEHEYNIQNIFKERLLINEERLNIALDISKYALWDLKIQDNSMYISPQYYKMLGYEPDEFIPSPDLLRSFIHPEDIHVLSEVKFGKENHLLEYRMMKKTRDWVWVIERSKIVSRSSNGRPQRVVGILIDNSERKNYEKQLLIYTEELKNLNISKDKFFSIISHDLRGPLQGLLGISEILSDDTGDLTRKQIAVLANELNKTVKNQFNLLTNLLEWSRIQTGAIKYAPVQIALSVLTEQIMLLFDENAKQKSIKLENTIEPNKIVKADNYMLNSVIRNLLSNAIKFTPSNGKIIISSHTEKDFEIVTVSDTGVGMSEKELNKLFAIENKLSNPGTANEKGTGLGLILCKEFVETNGGKIWVESKINQGSEFHFTVPVYKQ
jgi:PAS domain S-box-containing protein